MPFFISRLFSSFSAALLSSLFSRLSIKKYLQLFFLLITGLALASCKTTSPNLRFDYSQTLPLYYSGDINTNPNDNRKYHTFVLDNGLEVVVVSDANIVSSAASLTVGVGFYDDPDAYLGLSHYLEHMILTGSERFPETNSFQKLMSENSGFTNAYTHPQHTHYFFQINTTKLDTALDMFSASISNPLLDSVYSSKEISAVHEEWQIAREKQYYVASRVMANTSNPEHPATRFTVGNLESLAESSPGDLNHQLKQLHSELYTADKMKLVLASNHSLDDLKAMVVKYFEGFKGAANITNKTSDAGTIEVAANDVANNNSELPPIHREQDYGKHIYVKTKEVGTWLELKFPMENNFSNWRSKSNFYLYKLFNSEEEGTLKQTLLDQGWLNRFSVSLHPNKYINSGEISLFMELSESGKSNVNQIIANIFAYTELIKTEGVRHNYFKQIKDQLTNSWRQSAQPEALEMVNMVSTDLQTMPVKDVLLHRYLATDFSDSEIQQILDNMTPDKMHVWHYSNTQDTDTQLHFANSSYKVTDFTPEDIVSWQQPSLALQLPPEQISTIEKSIVFYPQDKWIERPELVHQGQSSEAWLANSKIFTGRSGVLRLQLQTPQSLDSVKNHVMTLLINRVYQRKNAALKERVDQLYTIKVDDRLNQFSMLDISISNASEYHPALVEELMYNLKTLKVSQAQLAREVELYQSEIESMDTFSPDRRAYFEYRKLIDLPGTEWNEAQRLQAASQITVEEINAFHQTLLSHNYLNVFAFGYFNAAIIDGIALKARSILGKSSLVQRWKFDSDFVSSPQGDVSVSAAINEASSAVLDSYVYPEKSNKVRFQLFVLNQIVHQALFNELRTKQEFAYSVYSFQSHVHDYPSIALYLQSGNVAPKVIKEAFDKFLIDFQYEIEKLTPEIVAQIKHSILQQLDKTPQFLVTEAETFEYDWFIQNLDFDTQEQQIAAINEITKDRLIDLYHELFLSGKSQRLTVEVKGSQNKQAMSIQAPQP